MPSFLYLLQVIYLIMKQWPIISNFFVFFILCLYSLNFYFNFFTLLLVSSQVYKVLLFFICSKATLQTSFFQSQAILYILIFNSSFYIIQIVQFCHFELSRAQKLYLGPYLANKLVIFDPISHAACKASVSKGSTQTVTPSTPSNTFSVVYKALLRGDTTTPPISLPHFSLIFWPASIACCWPSYDRPASRNLQAYFIDRQSG